MTEWDGLLRIVVAALLGGVIGFDREMSNKEAGLRTMMLVSLGASLFMVSGLLLIETYQVDGSNTLLDPNRMAGYIVSGIGFLGGAIIFREGNRTKGVTTAASIWAVTGVGIACGAGRFIVAGGATVLIVIVLAVLAHGERQLITGNEYRKREGDGDST